MSSSVHSPGDHVEESLPLPPGRYNAEIITIITTPIAMRNIINNVEIIIEALLISTTICGIIRRLRLFVPDF